MVKKKHSFEHLEMVEYLGCGKYEPLKETQVLYFNDFFGVGIYHPKGIKMVMRALSETKGEGYLEQRIPVLFVSEKNLKKIKT